VNIVQAKVGLTLRAWRYRLRDDPAEVRYLLQHVSRGQTVVDIGAHKGGYTYWLRRAVGPGGRVFAFEPQPRMAGYLRQVFPPSERGAVVVENVAVSDRNGVAQLLTPQGTSQCGATLEERANPRASYPIPTTTLDSYFEAMPSLRISFVKCDVEGHELSVFKGASRILREHRPVLLFECETRHTGGRPVSVVFDHLTAAGYRGWFFWNGSLRSVSEFDPATMQRSPEMKPYLNNFAFEPRV
jgi:FkbM family methyltransferase